MRGQQDRSGPLFSYVSTEERIPEAHHLRQVRRLADQALNRLNLTFCRLYPKGGRVLRSRRSNCCWPCFCKPSTASTRSGC